MDSNKIKSKQHPQVKANILSKIFLWWARKLFINMYKKSLSLEDFYDPLSDDYSTLLGDKLEMTWNLHLHEAKSNKKKPKLWKTIFHTFKSEFLTIAIFQIMTDIFLAVLMIEILSMLLTCFKNQSTTTETEIYLYGAAAVVIGYVKIIILCQKHFLGYHIGGRIRLATSSLIYRKTLRLSKTTLGEKSPGKIVNLIANDVNKFEFLIRFSYFVWSTPITMLFVTAILYFKYSYFAVIGIAGLLIVVPFQELSGFISIRYKKMAYCKTDERVRLLEEIVSAIEVIKIYAWEKPFCYLVERAREAEVKLIRKSSYFESICLAFKQLIPRVGLYTVIMTLYLSGRHFFAADIFILLPYFYLIAESISNSTIGLMELKENIISINRIESLLLLDEFSSNDFPNSDKEKNYLRKSLMMEYENKIVQTLRDEVLKIYGIYDKQMFTNFNQGIWAVNFSNYTAKWNLNSSINALEDVNLKLEKGKLYMVVGMVGMGKSSLLSSILEEINVINGYVNVNGKLSYASQDAWVFGDTIKQNILFGQDFNQKQYYRILDVCCLLQDLKQLPQGDHTIVGEKGVSLSGGQKARINLARAVYRQADIYLLDDPLSAVDAHVGKELFQNCIVDYLKNKTRILATHQLQYLKYVDGIIHIDHGKIEYFDSVHQLVNKCPEYRNLIAVKETEDSAIKEIITDADDVPLEDKGINPDVDHIDSTNVKNSANNLSNEIHEKNILLEYFHCKSGYFLIFITFILFLITQVTISLTDLFLLFFVTTEELRYYHYETLNDSYVILPLENNNLYSTEIHIYIYTALMSSIFASGILRSLVYSFICMRTSKYLHKVSFGALLKTNLRFFHENPSGRILNRLSKDISIVDGLLPRCLLEAVQIYLNYIGSVILICYVNPYFFIPTIIVATIYYCIQKLFHKYSMSIKYLEGITQAPIFTHLNESLNGVTTIRVCQTENLLKQKFDRFQDTHTSVWYYSTSIKGAYALATQILNFSFISIIIFGIIIFRDYFDEKTVGLVIAQLFSMGTMIAYASLLCSEIESQLTGVARLLEYSQLPSEIKEKDVALDQDNKINVPVIKVLPLLDWPTDGSINFKDLSLRYSQGGKLVLKNLNIVIKPKEKVGIVGRTGAGKTSLISALFRLAETKGTIEIDGLDIKCVSLETLRSRISIIPQDPTIFSGTIRHNIDPFHEYSDREIWDTLRQVELYDTTIKLSNGLESRMDDKGLNFSVGQRHLICLARAVLRKNQILIMDEATANVDPQTDILIQRTIRTKFASCTVLTIAHRLNTIMDSDKIIVMDNGSLIEFGHPYNLLRNESGKFTALVKETGEAMYQQLFKIAEDSHYNKVHT